MLQHVYARLHPGGAIWVRVQLLDRCTAIAKNADTQYLVYFPNTPFLFATHIIASQIEFFCQVFLSTFAVETVKQLDVRAKTAAHLSGLLFNKESQVWGWMAQSCLIVVVAG